LSNGWKGGDFFILLCLSFALYPILTLGNAVLSAMQEFTNLINCSHRKEKPKLQKFVEKFCGNVRPDTAAMAATASRNWHAEYCYLPESMYNNLLQIIEEQKLREPY